MLRNARTEIEGSVRLGGVLFLRHRRPEAGALLQGTIADAVALSDRYLARLFLGELNAVTGDTDAARRLLDEARAMAPDR